VYFLLSLTLPTNTTTTTTITTTIAGIGFGSFGVQRRVLRLLRRLLQNMQPQHLRAYVPSLLFNHDEIVFSDEPLDAGTCV
jgi:hypothetical protein